MIPFFSGTSHVDLAKAVCSQLGTTLGRMDITQFPDKEIGVRLLEDVRGKEVVVLQSCVDRPNHYLMELFLILDALRRGGARSIVTVLPYFPYCRQDRIALSGQPIAASLIASLLEKAGATKMISVDLHQGQLEGFFDTPFLQLLGRKALLPSIRALNIDELLFVGPDVGSIKIARTYAKDFGADFVVIDKHRAPTGEIDMRLIGSVQGKNIVITDDICSTATTLTMAAHLCKKLGAKRIFAVVTHALFAQGAIDQILSSPIERLFYTDTIPKSPDLDVHFKFCPVSIAPLLAEGIKAVITY